MLLSGNKFVYLGWVTGRIGPPTSGKMCDVQAKVLCCQALDLTLGKVRGSGSSGDLSDRSPPRTFECARFKCLGEKDLRWGSHLFEEGRGPYKTCPLYRLVVRPLPLVMSI